jgi:hypothetical protein
MTSLTSFLLLLSRSLVMIRLLLNLGLRRKR